MRPILGAGYFGLDGRRAGVVILLLVLAACLPTNVAAQTLTGSVLEEGRNTPVAGAVVSLVDRKGKRRAETISDAHGRFLLTLPEAGEYVVEASAPGYARTSSPLFSMTLEGSIPFDLMLQPIPIGLEGLEVSVEREAEQQLGLFGLTPTDLGRRWITHADIEKMPFPTGPREAIRWRNVAGLQVEPEIPIAFDDGRPAGGARLCVTIRQRGCAQVYLKAYGSLA